MGNPTNVIVKYWSAPTARFLVTSFWSVASFLTFVSNRLRGEIESSAPSPKYTAKCDVFALLLGIRDLFLVYLECPTASNGSGGRPKNLYSRAVKPGSLHYYLETINHAQFKSAWSCVLEYGRVCNGQLLLLRVYPSVEYIIRMLTVLGDVTCIHSWKTIQHVCVREKILCVAEFEFWEEYDLLSSFPTSLNHALSQSLFLSSYTSFHSSRGVPSFVPLSFNHFPHYIQEMGDSCTVFFEFVRIEKSAPRPKWNDAGTLFLSDRTSFSVAGIAFLQPDAWRVGGSFLSPLPRNAPQPDQARYSSTLLREINLQGGIWALRMLRVSCATLDTAQVLTFCAFTETAMNTTTLLQQMVQLRFMCTRLLVEWSNAKRSWKIFWRYVKREPGFAGHERRKLYRLLSGRQGAVTRTISRDDELEAWWCLPEILKPGTINDFAPISVEHLHFSDFRFHWPWHFLWVRVLRYVWKKLGTPSQKQTRLINWRRERKGKRKRSWRILIRPHFCYSFRPPFSTSSKRKHGDGCRKNHVMEVAKEAPG